MPDRPTNVRRTVLATLAASLTLLACAPAHTHGATASGPLAQVDVYDRVSGRSLSVHEKDGRQYIVGVPGHEYAVRIRNLTGRRILAVTSVDGVNVITGDTAAPDQSGYVIDAWGSVEIAGWRKSMAQTAAFFFTEHSNSYAARTGRPFDVGVIGVAVFAERAPRVAQRIAEPTMRDNAREGARADAPASAPALPPVPVGAASADAKRERAEDAERQAAAQPLAKLGTGHGRQETSYARQVTFERATATPAQLVAIQYDRYENLVAMGVLPGPQLAERTPRPFPGMRFVPDPR